MHPDQWGGRSRRPSNPPTTDPSPIPLPTPMIPVRLEEKTELSILLGHVVARAELDDETKVTVIASGSDIEFQVHLPNGKTRSFLADIGRLAQAAVERARR